MNRLHHDLDCAEFGTVRHGTRYALSTVNKLACSVISGTLARRKAGFLLLWVAVLGWHRNYIDVFFEKSTKFVTSLPSIGIQTPRLSVIV